MRSFPLRIVTPDGLQFDGQAQELLVRTTTGDMGILAGHVNCVAPLGMGRAVVVTEEGRREAACIGGILSVLNGKVDLVPTTFEWADTIDLKRAVKAEERARRILENQEEGGRVDRSIAEARLKRAMVRRSVAERVKKQ